MENLLFFKLNIGVIAIGGFVSYSCFQKIRQNKKIHKLIDEKKYMTVTEAYELLSTQSQAETSPMVYTHNDSFHCLLVGRLVKESLFSTQGRQTVWQIQDKTALDCIAMDVPIDPTPLHTVNREIVKENIGSGGVSNGVSYSDLLKGTPIAVLAKVYYDASNGYQLKIHNCLSIADSISGLKTAVEHDDFKNYLLLALSAVSIGFSILIIKDEFARRTRRLAKMIVDYFKRPNHDNMEEEQMCIVCFEKPRELLFHPCKHFLMCEFCFDHSVNRTRCPMCQGRILSMDSIVQYPAEVINPVAPQ